MNVEQAKYLHALMVQERHVEAANAVLGLLGQPQSITTKNGAVSVLQDLFQHLLDSELYLAAASLQWGGDVFQTEPESTTRSFEAMRTSSTVLFMGASSMGKTYGVGGWMLLDYLRDPLYTTLKLAAINEDHLRKNLFAHVVTLWRACAIPSRYEIIVRDSDMWMGVKDAGYEFGVSGIAFKQSQETSGQFKGYKAKPVRKIPHKKFGVMSRLRVLGDECFPYSQNVRLSDGSLMPIGEIVEKKLSPSVLSFNSETGSIQSRKVVNWFKVPRRGRKIVEINGAKMTEDHPVLTRYGLISAGQVIEDGLEVLEIHEAIPSKRDFKSATKVSDLWQPSWGCVSRVGERSEKRESKIRPRDSAVRISEMEEGRDGGLVLQRNNGSVPIQMGRNNVQVLHRLPPGVHKSERLDLRETEYVTKENHRPVFGERGRSCSGRVVHGRRMREQERKYAFGKVMHMQVSCSRPELGGRPSKNDGDRIESENLPWVQLRGLRNESHAFADGEDRQVFSSGPVLQAGRASTSRKANLFAGYVNQEGDPVCHLRKAVPEASEGNDVLEEVLVGTSENNGEQELQDFEEGDYVYCIEVEGNHNFFAESLCVSNCQNWPGGPFKDFNSLVASKTGTELIKIACAFNPESTGQLVVQMAEPEQGWNVDDMETLYDWQSRYGWRVCRLDAARSENVIQKKVIYAGLQTYEGYLSYLKAGGDNSPNYFCFARGWPPVKGTYNNVVPPNWPTEQRGEAVFIETPKVVATVDIAFQGGDSAQMAVGRWGKASGWRNNMGKFIKFHDRLNVANEKPRHLLQIDQLLPMDRHEDTVRMAEEIMGRCKMLQIPPEQVAVDMTGYGFGVHSHLVKVWGNVYGIGWNSGSTETKILAEDVEAADKQCDGIMSEMWWAFRRWLDPACCAILINPIIPVQPLHTQLTSRRFSTVKAGKIKVESKDNYKARNAGRSPDEADAVVMLPQLVRRISDILPGLVEQESRSKSPDGAAIQFQQANKIPSIESDDSLAEENEKEIDHIEV